MKSRRSQKSQGKWAANLSSVTTSGSTFERVEESRHTGGAAEAENHQGEMEGKNAMRNREQDPRKSASTQVRQNTLCRFRKRQCRIVEAESLNESTYEQEQHHQSDAIGRAPEVQLDQCRIAPLATN